MTRHQVVSWRDDVIGVERVVRGENASVRMAFGIGPPMRSSDPEERMTAVLAELEPESTALRWGQQIHGRLVASIAPEPEHPLDGAACVGRCDALITDEPGIGLAVWTADCVPLLVHGGGVVAAVHSGWRGAAADISGAVVDRFRAEFGVPPTELRVVLGPSISGECYEVGNEVIDGLCAVGVEESLWRDRSTVDLRSFLIHRLKALGIARSAIETVGGCTFQTPELASFRRDGENAGRQWSLIYRPLSTI